MTRKDAIRRATFGAAALALGIWAVACDQILGLGEGQLAKDASSTDGVTTDASGDGGADAVCLPHSDAQFVQCAPDAEQTNVEVDSKNCGGCGHSCLGGDCEGGLCSPSVVTVEEDTGVFVSVIGSLAGEVYWAENSTTLSDTFLIRAKDRDWDGGARTVGTVGDTSGLYGAALDDSGVYYYYRLKDLSYSLARVGLDGTGQTILNKTLISESTIVDLALDQTYVYLADRTSVTKAVPKTGGDAASYGNSVLPQNIVVDDSGTTEWISWLNDPWLHGAGEGGTLVSYKGAPNRPFVKIALENPSGLVASDGWLYFFDNTKTRLGRVREGADAAAEGPSNWSWVPDGGVGPASLPGEVISVAGSEAFIGVVNGAGVYEVVALSLCGYEPRLRAIAAYQTGPFAADDTYIYWGSYNHIVRMAK